MLVIFVLVDDLYKKVAPKAVKKRPNINKAILSDSEVITIALCGEIMGIDSEKAWYSFVKKNYRHLFPKMCDRSQFNRTRRNLTQVMNLIFPQINGRSSFLRQRAFIFTSKLFHVKMNLI